MRLKKPCVASPEQVRITREGEYAIIEYADSSIMTVHFKIGPDIGKMTDQDILDLHNDIVRAREEMAAGYEHVAVEIPRGCPQIEYHLRADQWTPRGGVLRCVIEDGGSEEGPIFYVDDEELTLREFGRLLSTYAGWGMRIIFVPDDRLMEQPPLRFETRMRAISKHLSPVWTRDSAFHGNLDRESKNRVLVAWRNMTNLYPVRDWNFLEAKSKEIGPFEERWVNGDSAVKDFASLDALFKRLTAGDET